MHRFSQISCQQNNMRTCFRSCIQALVIFIAISGIFVGCGQTRSADNLGDPLYTYRGVTQGQALQAAQGEYRAMLSWASVGASQMANCLEAREGMESLACFALPSLWLHSTADAQIEAVFPASFRLPIFALPAEEMLLADDDARLAFAQVLVYDDVNNNGQLDYTSFTAAQANDVVVGSSQSADGLLTTLGVYREGGLHPFWRVLQEFWGCEEPPLGFSVLRLDNAEVPSCVVSATEEIVVTLAADTQTQMLACQGTPSWQPVASQYPDTALPNNAVYACSDDGTELSYYLDQGFYCDPALQQILRLEGCHNPDICVYSEANPDYWNLINDPPVWWPCAVQAQPSCDSCHFVGSYSLDEDAPVSVDVAVTVARFTTSAPDELAGSGISLLAQFGPEPSQMLVRMRLYDSVPTGLAAQSGQTYDMNVDHNRPVFLSVQRYLPSGSIRYTVPEQWGEVELSSFNSQAGTTNAVELRDFFAPASDGLEAYRISGRFDFVAPAQ